MKRNEIIVTDPHERQTIQASCGFCGEQARSLDSEIVFDGSLWSCGCGALGLSCTPADFDEAADQWIEHLGLGKALFAHPKTPIGTSGRLSLQSYNNDQTLSEVLAFFPQQGFRVLHEEVETTYRYPGGKVLRWFSWFVWARRG